ncbi:MAG: hypothetical protein ACI9TO_000161 [Rickettsiales bacterium]|jgi:hypothetical protein
MTEKYRRPKNLNGKSRSVLEAKFEAQKLAFAPLSFHAAKTMRDLGILEIIHNSRKNGILISQITEKLKISNYGVSTLLEVGLGLDLVTKNDEKFFLTKTGFFILFDEMTRVNMDFVADVCYQGAQALTESIVESKPAGLKVFGDWETVYQGLSSLPKKVQNSWFAFDHFYSDDAFDDALPIIFKDSPKRIFDIGGNTGKWAVKCLKYNAEAKITILDLPGQLKVALENLTNLNFQNRSDFFEIDLLNPASKIPTGSDVIWMSQFLDCFSKDQITDILQKVANSADQNCQIYILEPFWDRQKYEAATFSLNHTSLYFTTIANGNSKMYSASEMTGCIEAAGLKIDQIFDDIGNNEYTLLKCSKK